MAKARAVQVAPRTLARLRELHPDAHCEIDHASPFQLIVATVLSAQTTDVLVNRITPDLFRKWPTAPALASAPVAEIEATINRIGMFRQKSKNISGLAKLLVERHGGQVPRTLDELVALPGVGRKTANVVLGVAFGTPEGVVVDTHVQRISQRLGWTKQTTPEKIEKDLMKTFPRDAWDPLSHTLIFHGRRICSAIKPACAACSLTDVCPCAFKAEKVGRKAPRVRGGGARATVATGAKAARGDGGAKPGAAARGSGGAKPGAAARATVAGDGGARGHGRTRARAR